jgi:CO/xanthine dehydrogenase FAD-binding subunit
VVNPPTILAPSCLDELERLEPLLDTGTDGSRLRLVGGGTLEVPRWQSAGPPRYAVHLPALRELHVRGADVCGAGRSLAQIAADRDLPTLLREMASVCATPPVRTLATLGGNVASCQPGCLAVALLAMHAVVTVFRPGHGLDMRPVSRVVPDRSSALIDAAFPPRVLVSVAWPDRPHASGWRRLTVQAASGPVLATVAVARHWRPGGLRWTVAAGGSGVRPQRLRVTERVLDAAAVAPLDVENAAAQDVTIEPFRMPPGDEDYRRQLVGVLVARAAADTRAQEER